VKRHVGRGTFTAIPKQDKPIAILCDLDLSAPQTYSYLERVLEVRRQIEEHGRSAVIYLGNNTGPVTTPPEALTCKSFLRHASEDRFAGVIAVWGLPQESWTVPLQRSGIPVVGLNLLYEYAAIDDFEAFVRLALKSLRKRGRKRIAYLGAISNWNL